jgi:hypothetical protein
MDMQRSNRRARFGWWFLLIWAAAVLVMMIAYAIKSEPEPRFDGATLVYRETRWEHV